MLCYRKLMRSTQRGWFVPAATDQRNGFNNWRTLCMLSSCVAQRALLTSALGLALWMPATPGLAQEAPKSAVQQQLEELYMRDGRDLPDMVIPQYDAPPEVQTTAGANRRSGEPRGFFDRVRGIFRRDKSPTVPPRDPGMNRRPAQPTPPQQRQTQTPRPNNFVPPPVPGSGAEQPSLQPATPRGNNRESLSTQPGRFQPPASANPIQQPRSVAQPAPEGAVQPHTTIQPRQSAERPDPGPSQAQRAPETAAVPPAPSGVPQDPFDNLFPEEPEEVADAQSGELDEMPPTVTETSPADNPEAGQPYTGLKLEEDLFSQAGPDPMAEQRKRESREWIRQQQEQNESPGDQFAARDSAPEREPAGTTHAEKPRSIEVPPVDELPTLPEPSPKKTAPTPPADSSVPAKQDERQSKMERIAARKGRSGLKGFCPVALRDHRELVDAAEEYAAVFNGKLYHFSSDSAMEKFLNEPSQYAPAARGVDVIHLALTGGELEGSLDYAVWYKGRLYLFAGVETMETFVAAPSSHATSE